jgi:flagellar biosynthetic protein FlhB
VSERDQRTEKATPQRLKKAREEGKYPASKEFVAGVQFAVFVAILVWAAGSWSGSLVRGTRSMIRAAFNSEFSAGSLSRMAFEVASLWLLPLAFAGLALVATAVLAQMGVTGFGLASSKIAPDFSRLNPTSKLKEMPSRNLSSLGEAGVFFALISYVGWKVFAQYSPEFLSLPYRTLGDSLLSVGTAFSRLFLLAALLIFVWGSIDLFRQRRRYANQMKMTKQEVKQEYKQSEGSPEIKMRIRRLRHEILRRRMMAEVPKATAIVVNPTHYAVALRYEHLAMAAPKVVAMGKNFMALRIRELAKQHLIPIIENPPLAQALYKNCEVGQEIPANLYRAVAEVLAYVFKILNRQAN